LKNFLGDRASNVSRKETVLRCSRGLSGLKSVRKNFGDKEPTSGVHRKPEDTRDDIKLAVQSLDEAIFEDKNRPIGAHPIPLKKALFDELCPPGRKNFVKYVQDVTNVVVVDSSLPVPSQESAISELSHDTLHDEFSMTC
jgi:hypothetical protein